MATKNRRKKLGNYPYFSVVFSNTMALLVIGVFGLLLLYSKKLTNVIRENIEMQIYLNKDVTENGRIKIDKTLGSKDYVLRKDGVPQVSFISKESAAEIFIESTGEDFINFLGDNPLHDAYTIKIASEYQGKEQMEQIQNELQSFSEVFDVIYQPNLIQSINDNTTKIGLFLLIPTAILLLAVIILINSAIKLALFSQRFLIRSMQLVGATSVFIRKPFLFRATVHGLISGMIASALLFAMISFANKEIMQLQELYNQSHVFMLFGMLLFIGALVGILSTQWAISRYLKMSLDELY